MHLANKIKLQPTKKQEEYFLKACGVSRFSYNWALERMWLNYENNIKSSKYDLCKELNAIKHNEFPWMTEVSKWSPQKSVYDLHQAFRNWWNNPEHFEKPKYKKKGKCQDSFYLGQNHFKVEGKKIYIPKLGFVRTTKPLRFNGKLLSLTISRHNDSWYASVLVEINKDTFKYPHVCENQDIVGVDLGIKSLLTLSNGTKVDPIKALYVYEGKLRRLQRKLKNKKKGSNNLKKLNLRITRLHTKISNIRNNFLHLWSSFIVRNFRYIGVEDLNVKGMLKNHKLAKSIQDSSWGEFIRQLEYKSKLANSYVIKADRWFASSKICSKCGYKYKDLNLNDRFWLCPDCGTLHDRDLNASYNLEKIARGYREILNACGGNVSLTFNNEGEKFSLRQESDFELNGGRLI